MNKDARLDIRIPADLKHQISIEAARDKRSMANVIILAVTAYLEGKSK